MAIEDKLLEISRLRAEINRNAREHNLQDALDSCESLKSWSRERDAIEHTSPLVVVILVFLTFGTVICGFALFGLPQSGEDTYEPVVYSSGTFVDGLDVTYEMGHVAIKQGQTYGNRTTTLTLQERIGGLATFGYHDLMVAELQDGEKMVFDIAPPQSLYLTSTVRDDSGSFMSRWVIASRWHGDRPYVRIW